MIPDQEHGAGPDEQIPRELMMAFAPLHKRAFGIAIGVSLGALVFLITIGAVVRPEVAEFAGLLVNYFPGHSVSIQGALVGLVWGTFSGFVFGWFAAFCRNFVLASSLWLARTRAELNATRDFLDHI